VQAYWLTSPVILRAIAGAKRRGLDVAAILDKTQDGCVYEYRPTRADEFWPTFR
jgi:phosphatidylserine/phosphatidylglycerophosphate/cardiolipin synthase-like enzyme